MPNREEDSSKEALFSAPFLVVSFAELFSCVRLLAALWTVACQAPLSMRILQARILEWVAMPSSREIFPTQGLSPGLPHCRWVFTVLSFQGSLPTILLFLSTNIHLILFTSFSIELLYTCVQTATTTKQSGKKTNILVPIVRSWSSTTQTHPKQHSFYQKTQRLSTFLLDLHFFKQNLQVEILAEQSGKGKITFREV